MSFIKELWINTDQRELVKGFLETLAENNITFIQGDNVPLRVYLLKELTNNQGRPFKNIPVSSETLKVALGRLDKPATGGTFILTFDGDSTTALPYNETAANVETALNLLASITSAGGVSVTGEDGGPYTVTFTNDGARNGFTGDVTLLEPISDLIVTTVIEGDGSTQEVQVLKLKESPIAVQDMFTIIPDPTIVVTEVIKGAAGVNEIQKVAIDQVCQDGSFTLSYDSSSAVISYGATSAQVVTALESTASISSGDVAVQKLSDTEYDITFQGSLAGTDVDLLIANSSGLIGFSGFEADFDLGSYAVDQLLDGSNELSDDLYFEIEFYNNPDRSTILRLPGIIQNDLIDESVIVPPNNGVDWDALLDAKADKVNVLELDNTDAFTPSADYEPATKKYVDDAGTGDMETSTYDPAAIAEQLTGLTATQSLTNKTINGVVLNDGGAATSYLDETGNYSTPSALPVDDTTSIVQDPGDNTKQMRIDVGAVTTATTRVLTMPDSDVTAGTDADALHKSIASEISALTQKVTPVNGDFIVIEDSADSNNKKYVLASNFLAGSGDVSASSNLTDNSLIRGDGGSKGVQDSGILIDDTDNITGVASIEIDSVDLQEYVAAGNDNNQTGTTYTLVIGDAENTTVWMDNASANTLTIPTNASVAFPVGTKINVMMEGAGVTTIEGDTGVTVNGTSGGSVDIGNQYSGATLSKRATDTWIVTGDVS